MTGEREKQRETSISQKKHERKSMIEKVRQKRHDRKRVKEEAFPKVKSWICRDLLCKSKKSS